MASEIDAMPATGVSAVDQGQGAGAAGGRDQIGDRQHLRRWRRHMVDNREARVRAVRRFRKRSGASSGFSRWKGQGDRAPPRHPLRRDAGRRRWRPRHRFGRWSRFHR